MHLKYVTLRCKGLLFFECNVLICDLICGGANGENIVAIDINKDIEVWAQRGGKGKKKGNASCLEGKCNTFGKRSLVQSEGGVKGCI